MNLENYMQKMDFALEKAYDVTVDSLKNMELRLCLLDLDNTLIAWNNPDGTPEMRQWLHDLRDAGIPVVVSNNKYERVKRAVEKFGIEAFASQTVHLGINRALKRFNVQPHEVVMITIS